MAAEPRRRRRLRAFFTLCMLVWGRHGSVTWLSQRRCRIRPAAFSSTLGSNTTVLRKDLEWLKRHRLLAELDYGQGWIECTIAEQPVREVA